MWWLPYSPSIPDKSGGQIFSNAKFVLPFPACFWYSDSKRVEWVPTCVPSDSKLLSGLKVPMPFVVRHPFLLRLQNA